MWHVRSFSFLIFLSFTATASPLKKEEVRSQINQTKKVLAGKANTEKSKGEEESQDSRSSSSYSQLSAKRSGKPVLFRPNAALLNRSVATPGGDPSKAPDQAKEVPNGK